MRTINFLLMVALLIPTYTLARNSNYCHTCERTPSGKIKRSSEAKTQFKQTNPCPSTGSTQGGCNGYVIDHVMPLKRGGDDTPSNMQWQTKEQAKQKDKWE